MNLTLSVDEKMVELARRNANAMGTSLNQLVREYIQKLARAEDIEQTVAEFEALSGKGEFGDWKFNRDELHERR